MTKQYQINGIIVGCSLEYYERHDCYYVSGGEVEKLPYGRGEAPQIKAAIKAFAREEKLDRKSVV